MTAIVIAGLVLVALAAAVWYGGRARRLSAGLVSSPSVSGPTLSGLASAAVIGRSGAEESTGVVAVVERSTMLVPQFAGAQPGALPARIPADGWIDEVTPLTNDIVPSGSAASGSPPASASVSDATPSEDAPIAEALFAAHWAPLSAAPAAENAPFLDLRGNETFSASRLVTDLEAPSDLSPVADREAVPVFDAGQFDAAPPLNGAPSNRGAPITEPLSLEPPSRWWARFDSRSGSLSETARLRLIGDLGVIAKPWCIPLLAQAYVDEERPSHREAALIALAACRSTLAVSTFTIAVASDRAAERAIAADALADLEPPPRPRRPRTVERY